MTSPNVSTGDFLYLWDASAALTYKVYVNDIAGIEPSADAWFNNIYVRRYARISGIIGGSTGTNLISGLFPGILAGQTNRSVGNNTSVVGGASNLASGVDSSACGNGCQVLSARSVVFGGINNTSAGPGDSAILAGDTNKILYADGSVIMGGITNVITGLTSYSAIIGGQSNRLMALRSTIVGGQFSKVSGNDASVVGGNTNLAQGHSSSVIGGDSNVSSGIRSTVIGGQFSRAMGTSSTVIGGDTNLAIGNSSTVLGGDTNVSSGAYTYTLGNRCEAFYDGAVMFGDSTAVTKRAYGQDSFTINYSGGVWITGGGLNARRGFNVFPTGDVPTASTPGRSGDYAYKDNYLYIYTGIPTDTNRHWGRVALSSLTDATPGQSIVSNKSSQVNPRGNDYACTTTFANVVHSSDGYPVTDPAILIPAGNATYYIDLLMGCRRGSDQTTQVHYRLFNTTDSTLINNTSGYIEPFAPVGVLPNQIGFQQFRISTIVNLNYASAKTVYLQVRQTPGDAAGVECDILPTGGFLRYIVLE